MDQNDNKLEIIPVESESDCEYPTIQPLTMDSTLRTGGTESPQDEQLVPGTDCSVGQPPNGQANELQRQSTTTPPATRVTSEKKKAANRANGQKSTGPKTTQGKANSRRNAMTHGLLAQKALCDSQGNPQDDGYRVLYEQLCAEYPGEDLVTQLRRELVLAGYWRNTQALRYERDLMERRGVEAFQTYAMPLLHRYSVANQKALTASLQALEESASSAVQLEEEGAASEDEEIAAESAEAATITEGYNNHDSVTDITATLTEPAMVDPEPTSSNNNDILQCPTGEEITLTTESGSESFDLSLSPERPLAGGGGARQISDDAELEEEVGSARSALIQ